MSELEILTISDYVAILRRRWRPAVAVTAFVLLSAVYVAYSRPVVYESSTTVMIEQRGVPEDLVQVTVDTYAEERLQTIFQRVLATASVIDIIEYLDLYPDARGAVPEGDMVEWFQGSTVISPQNVSFVNARTGREGIMTFGFEIAFRYGEPVKARDVVEELARRVVSYNTEFRAATAAQTTAFLDTETGRLEQQLAEVAERIADFKERHAGNLPEDQMVNLTTWERLRTDLTQVEERLRDTRERKALLESELAETPRYRPVMDTSGEPVLGGVDRLAAAQQELIRLLGRYSENHPEVINLRREIATLSASPTNRSNLLQQLRTDLETRRQELSAARESYSDSHPEVVNLRRTVTSLEQQIAAMAAEAASAGPGSVAPNNPIYVQLLTRIGTADSELADLTRLRNDLTVRVEEYERRRLAAPQVEREYTAIAHEQDLLINQYGNLRTLGNEAALGEALETGQSGERLTILDPPRVPTSPIGANPLAISFLGMIVAIGLGLGVVPLLEVMDSKIRGQHDVFRILEMPPIGVIPYLETTGDTLKRVTLDVGLGALIIAGAIYVVVTALL